MKVQIIIIASMLMGISAFGQLLEPNWEPKFKDPKPFFEDEFKFLKPDFSKFNKLKLQGVGGVFVPENLGKMTLVPKTEAKKED